MKRWTICFTAVLMIAAAAAVSADGGDGNLIHACVAKGGDVRIVGPGEACKASEQAVHWGIQGPAGPKGDRGEPAIPPPTPYAGSWLVYVDGQFAGRLADGSLDGCGVEGAVVEQRLGTDSVVRKSVGSIRFTDCLLSVGADMSPAFWQWINGTFTNQFQRKSVVLRRIPVAWGDGTINAPTIEIEIPLALIDGIAIPTLRRSDTAGVSIDVSLAPEFTRRRAATCCVTSEAMTPVTPFDASTHGFSFVGSGAVNPTTIGNVRFVLDIPENPTGETRDFEQEPTRLRVPSDIDVRVASGSAGWSLLDTWFDDFVIKGNNGDDKERQATLELPVLGQSTRKLTLQLGGVGISRGDHAERVDGSVRFGLYAETATLTGP